MIDQDSGCLNWSVYSEKNHLEIRVPVNISPRMLMACRPDRTLGKSNHHHRENPGQCYSRHSHLRFAELHRSTTANIREAIAANAEGRAMSRFYP